jgi:hypothetical protein
MIARISSTIVRQPALELCVERWRTTILPSYVSSQGLIVVCLLQRSFVDYIELMTLSVWKTQEALDQFLQRGTEIVVPEGSDDTIQLEGHTYDLVAFHAGSAYTWDY